MNILSLISQNLDNFYQIQTKFYRNSDTVYFFPIHGTKRGRRLRSAEQKGEGSWSRGSANASARCIKRAAMGAHGGHSTADRPVHRLLLQSQTPSPAPPRPSESTRLRATATAPIERTGRLSGASPRLFTKTPTPPASLFSRTRTHALPDSNRRRRRRESRDSPSASGGLRPPVPPVVPSPQTAFATVPSPLPRRGP
jgi:hypothetical protein